MNWKLWQYTIMLLVGEYVLILAMNGGLAFYIHPRYFLVTTIAGALVTIVGWLGLFRQLQGVDQEHSHHHAHDHEHHDHELDIEYDDTHHHHHEIEADNPNWRNQLLVILLAIVAAIGLILPPQSLSTRAASQRSSTTNVVTSDDIGVVSSFISDKTSYGLGSWVSEIAKSPNTEKLVGEEVVVSGFIFVPESAGEDQFQISRFVVRCCVVDASPVGLLVGFGDWAGEFSEGDWVEVRGVFELDNNDDQPILFVAAESVTVIDEPDNPYIY